MKKSLMIIPPVILLCFAFGCQQGEEVAEEPAIDVEADIEAIKNLREQYMVSQGGNVFLFDTDNYAFNGVLLNERNRKCYECLSGCFDTASYYLFYAFCRGSRGRIS